MWLAHNQDNQNKIRGIILENTFTSISDLIDNFAPLGSILKPFIQKLFWPSIDRIPKIETPILFVRGLKDELIPSWHTQSLIKAAKSSKYIKVFECANGDHNHCFLFGKDKYYQSFHNFFEKCE